MQDDDKLPWHKLPGQTGINIRPSIIYQVVSALGNAKCLLNQQVIQEETDIYPKLRN